MLIMLHSVKFANKRCVHPLQFRPAFLQGRISCCITAQLGPNNHLTVLSHTSSAPPAPFALTVQAPAATLAWHHAVPHAAAKHCCSTSTCRTPACREQGRGPLWHQQCFASLAPNRHSHKFILRAMRALICVLVTCCLINIMCQLLKLCLQ